MDLQASLFISVLAGWFINLVIFSRISNIWVYSILSLPGTLAHEAAHFVVGLLLNARPAGFFGGLTLIPKRENNGWTLGSVSFYNINSFNALPVALAPMLLLLTPLLIGFYIDIGTLSLIEKSLIYIVIAFVAHSAIPSEQDIRIMFSRPLSIVLWGGIGYLVLKYLFNMI